MEMKSDQNNILDRSGAPDHSISTSNEDQNHENTTPSVNLSITESQELSEPKPEVQCSYNKKGKCKLHNQIGNKTVRKRSVWVKKKFGYGWVTKQVTEYNCNQSTGSKMPELSSQ